MNDDKMQSSGVPAVFRPVVAAVDRLGLPTFLTLVLVGVLIWITTVKLETIQLQLTAHAQEATSLRGEIKALKDSFAEAVRLLDSIDRRMCFRDARNSTERGECFK